MGRVCSTFSNQQLIDILWSIDGPLPDNHIIVSENDRENIIQQILNNVKMRFSDGMLLGAMGKYYYYDDMINWNLEKLTFFYNWLRSRPTKQYICEIIKNRLIEPGMIKYL